MRAARAVAALKTKEWRTVVLVCTRTSGVQIGGKRVFLAKVLMTPDRSDPLVDRLGAWEDHFRPLERPLLFPLIDVPGTDGRNG